MGVMFDKRLPTTVSQEEEEISRRITPKDKELKPTPASSTVTLKQAFLGLWLTP